MKKIKWLLVFLVIVTVILAGWKMRQNNDSRKGYITEPVSRGSIRNTISSSGSLAAITTVEVGSQVSGNIEKIFVDFNDKVTAGQLIAKLEDSTFEAQLQQAKANLENARASEMGVLAQMKNLKASMLTAQAEIQVSKANVRKAEVGVEDAQRNFNRFKELFAKQLVSAAERDQALTALESQKATVDAVKAQLESSKARVVSISAQMEASEADLNGARARVRQMEAQLKVAQINLERTSIFSPIDGVVISREVDEGQTVAASLQAPKLFIIAQDLKKMQIDTAVDEADIGLLEPGQQVSFNVDAYKNRTFKGVVDQVRLSPNETSNVVTYSVMVKVENDDLLLKPGMTANAEILVSNREGALRLPLKAQYFKAPPDFQAGARQGKKGKGGGRRDRMQNATDSLPIWLLSEDEKVERKRVKIGISNQEFIEILDDAIKEGDRVIVGIQGEVSASERENSRRSGVRMRF